MFWLSRLLLLERYRRLVAQYGIAGSVSLAAMLLALGWAAGEGIARLSPDDPFAANPAFWNHVWIAWVAAGFFLGRDLTWHVRLDRLKAFPVTGFGRLFSLTLPLSLVSFPVWVLLLVLWIGGSTPGQSRVAGLPFAAAGYALFVTTVRTAASLTRSAVYSSSRLPGRARVGVFLLVALLIGWIAAALANPGLGAALPGCQFGALLAGEAVLRPLLGLAGMTLLLGLADAAALRVLAYSGVCGPPAPRGRMFSGAGLLLWHASWPPPLWRISLLGWLRNRNSLLLLLWGTSYGFLFLYFSRPEEAFDFIAFVWLVQVFHSYLRGNLLGVDHAAVWVYYMLPSPVHSCVQAKSRTLNLMQGGMVAAVLLPGLIHPVPSMDPASWLRIISYAYSSILAGEIGGSILSLRYPEPIERGSHFSGGMAPGGMLVPLLQLVFLAVFMTATGLMRLFLPPILFWIGLVLTPALLIAVRSLVLPRLLQKTMLDKRTILLARLSVFSS